MADMTDKQQGFYEHSAPLWNETLFILFACCTRAKSNQVVGAFTTVEAAQEFVDKQHCMFWLDATGIWWPIDRQESAHRDHPAYPGGIYVQGITYTLIEAVWNPLPVKLVTEPDPLKYPRLVFPYGFPSTLVICNLQPKTQASSAPGEALP